MNEMMKLHNLLTDAGIPHTYEAMPAFYGADAKQIRVYADAEMTNELDDAVYHAGAHGYTMGLLETYYLNNCDGFETAEQVFEGWKKMYQRAQSSSNTTTAQCSVIGAGGEVWNGSAPSWD